jgi:hypothetical protein
MQAPYWTHLLALLPAEQVLAPWHHTFAQQGPLCRKGLLEALEPRSALAWL